MANVTPYSVDELKNAFFTFTVEGSINVEYDNRHVYGFNNQNDHQLSMLQTITATVLLDYQNKLLSSETPTIEQLQQITQQQIIPKYGPILNLQNIILLQQPSMALAAEFKRASPSKGNIAIGLNAGEQATIYATAGASIISVLTEPRWFKGSLNDLTQVRHSLALQLQSSSTDTPKRSVAILRKDFVINEYMIEEAAAAGADTVLLIVAVLPEHKLKQYITYSRTLGMEPLVEVHSDMELDVAVAAGAIVIGVNNRNLHTFQLDMTTTERIASKLATINAEKNGTTNNNKEFILCALSGMSTCYDVDRYRQCNVQMCLIGESLMRSTNPAAAITSLCLHPNDFAKMNDNTSSNGGDNSTGTNTLTASAYTRGTQLIKVCGITNSKDALVACRDGANLIGIIFAEKSKRRVTIEQAIDVVNAVRQFGERNTRLSFQLNEEDNNTSKNKNPLLHLIGTSRILMQTIRQPNRPAVVGVFQNQSFDFINNIIKQTGIDIIQLHGNEGMAAANPNNYILPTPVIRVIDIPTSTTNGSSDQDNEDNDPTKLVDTILQGITTDPFVILLDTSIKGATEGGGTGIIFNWDIVTKLQNCGLPIVLAGGLQPDTVGDCVERIRPFGVDVSSGVEQSPGIKDPTKVQQFLSAVRTAANEANKGF